jgi:hypothetical protein
MPYFSQIPQEQYPPAVAELSFQGSTFGPTETKRSCPGRDLYGCSWGGTGVNGRETSGGFD